MFYKYSPFVRAAVRSFSNSGLFSSSVKSRAPNAIGFRIARVVNSGANASVSDVPGTCQQRVASSGKQLSGNARLKFRSEEWPLG
jgi:hypothetical protein